MIKTIGIVELSSISQGIEACDTILKRASVQLIQSQPMCPGKYVITFYGDMSSVVEGVNHVQDEFAGFVLDGVVIGNIDERVIQGLIGSSGEFRKDAVGIVETYTVASAIRAADAGIKAADVDIVELRTAHGMGGKGFVLMSGTISSVTAAVDAGARQATEEGMLASKTVIPSPHPDIWSRIV